MARRNRQIGRRWGRSVAVALVAVVLTSWTSGAVAQGADAQGTVVQKDAGATSETGGEASGRRITDVRLECGLERCDNPVEREKLLSIAGLYPGRTWSASLEKTARSRFAKTGLFTSVSFEETEAPTGGIELLVRGVGATRVRKVQFEGVDPPPFRSELRKLLLYRPGEAYEDDDEKKSTQLESLESEYQKAGFFGTDIAMQVEQVGGRSKLVDITFEIDKGKRLEICDVGFRGLEALSYPEARRALLSELSIFARRFRIVPPRFTTDVLDAGIEELVRRYRRQGYYQARVVGEHADRSVPGGCVRILVDVDEGPHWKVSFSGNDVVDSVELRQELPFLESGFVDSGEIERAERTVEEMYETRGHPFAEVEATEERTDRLNRRIVFEIRERNRYEIDDVVYHGVESIDVERLADEVQTRPFRLFESGGYVQTERVLGDARRIEKVYRERGFLRASVTRYEVERLGDRKVRLHFYVDEGAKTQVRRLEFEGVRNASRASLRRELKVTGGSAFVPVDVRADNSRLVQKYSSIGYPLTAVETSCRVVGGEAVPCERPKRPTACVADNRQAIEEACEWKGEERQRWVCRRVEETCEFEGGIGDATALTVEHAVREGPFVTAGHYLVQGNFRTRDRIFDQEIPLEEGDIFDVRELLAGQSNLRSLGIFDSVSLEAIGLDEEAGERREHRAALMVNVEESKNRFFDLKFGFEGRDLLGDRTRLLNTAEVQYNDRNLFGSALQMKPNIFGAADLLQTVSYGRALARPEGRPAERQLDYLLGAELTFRDPRFLKGATGIDKLYLTVTPFYLVDLVGVTNEQLLREEWGLALEVRKELSELLDRFYVSFGVEGKQSATAPLEGPRVDGERIFSPRRVTGKLIPELTLDRRDSPLNPSEGYLLRWSPEYVTGDALSPEVSPFRDSYLRMTTKADLFLPLRDEIVLAQSMRHGQVLPVADRPTRVPADERYFLGGSGSVRGFRNNSLGPQLNSQPVGGEFLLNYNVELRYPLLRRADLLGATFFDLGILADCFDDEAVDRRVGCWEDGFEDFPRKVRTGAGVGLRYVIAGQIPLLLDYGIALDRRADESYGNLHFQMGYTF